MSPALVAARAGLSRGWIEFRQTLATTVVSHPRMSCTWSPPDRLSRSQVSCTASSASVSEPSIR